MSALPDTSWCAKGGSRGYVVTHDLHWWIGKEYSGWLLTVPAGTEFESSVPWALTWVFSPDDPFYLKAAAVHDFLLERGYRPAFADVNWIEAALSVRAPAGRTWWAYRAMRLRRLLYSFRKQGGATIAI